MSIDSVQNYSYKANDSNLLVDMGDPSLSLRSFIACAPEAKSPAEAKLRINELIITNDIYPVRPTDRVGPRNVDITHLPLGDGKLVSLRPEKGFVLVSEEDRKSMAGSHGGAIADGPWINKDGTYNLLKKTAVDGQVSWKSNYQLTIAGKSIIIKGNALPSTTTGEFPIKPGSDAAKYDPNPNSIKPVDFTLVVPSHPQKADHPSPLGLGAVAVLKNGGLMYGPFDGAGKDANGHEIQDNNLGHPSETDYYHSHQVPSVLYEHQDKKGPAPVLGRALDGFPIVAAYKADGDLYSTAELDEYHGRVVSVKQEDGTVKEQWAYCVSLDWPYTIGAFRGTPSAIEGLKAPEIGDPAFRDHPPGPPPLLRSGADS